MRTSPLDSRDMTESENQVKLSIGVEFPTCHDIQTQLKNLHHNGFDFAVLPIVHPRFSRYDDVERYKQFTMPEDTLQNLSSFFYDWNRLLICRVECSLKDIESEYPKVQNHARELLDQELNYISYLGIPYVVLSLDSPNFINFARTIFSHAMKNPKSLFFYIKIPLTPCNPNIYRENGEDPVEDTWEWWNQLRTFTQYDSTILLALEITEDICDEEQLTRWLGEPLQMIFIATHIFQTNRSGYPVLNKTLTNFFKKALERNVQVIISGANRHQQFIYYVQYMYYLKKLTLSSDPLVVSADQFEDCLQYPLQPLSSDLNAFTYEVFEKDPIKYNRYQEAVYEALLDRVSAEQAKSVITTIMVVGAGRGPLVTASIAAAQAADREIKVFVVEKNRNAIVGLLHMRDNQWADSDVTVVSVDMRLWDSPVKADIMVSELLGSFGDNELSPECLYATQRYLKEDGISIPCSYTSYIGPIMSQKLYTEARNLKKDKFFTKHYLYGYEQPYVVYQRNRYEIAPPQRLFTFVHPCKEEDISYHRYKKLQFQANQDCVLHGLAGYFDTCLYKDISLSIHPETLSPGLISWFSLYFPIHEPLQVKSGSEIELHFWRKYDEEKVWYEWLISKPLHLPIHNINARSYKMKKNVTS